jgi:hypothetical protein
VPSVYPARSHAQCSVLSLSARLIPLSWTGFPFLLFSLGEFCEDLQSDDLSGVILFWPKDASQIDDDDKPHALNYSATNPEDFKKFMSKKQPTDPLTRLPPYLHEFRRRLLKTGSRQRPRNPPTGRRSTSAQEELRNDERRARRRQEIYRREPRKGLYKTLLLSVRLTSHTCQETWEGGCDSA